jgi:hypothetical protein
MKAQAALEFLMTYGWAILIVIAVVAALYAMGVFRLPSGGLGKISPGFPPGSAVAYVDHNANTLVLTVGQSTISGVSVTTTGGTTPGTSDIAAGPLSPGTTFQLNGTGIFAGNAAITVAYTDTTSGLSHSVTATLHGA